MDNGENETKTERPCRLAIIREPGRKLRHSVDVRTRAQIQRTTRIKTVRRVSERRTLKLSERQRERERERVSYTVRKDTHPCVRVNNVIITVKIIVAEFGPNDNLCDQVT